MRTKALHCPRRGLERGAGVQVRDFEALCGFCTLGEISKQLWDKPELRQCVGNARARAVTTAIGGAEATQRTALRGAFTALMTCDAACCAAASQQLHGRLRATDAACLSEKDELFLRVYEQYPGDVGTLSVFFLNHLRLAPGEAVYLAANEPHAYLSGELIEAMASSDNVIRAGLTPKLRDTGVRLPFATACVWQRAEASRGSPPDRRWV